MHQQHLTNQHPYWARRGYWQSVIKDTYFDLELRFGQNEGFDGSLECWDFGTLTVSRLQTHALSYQRLGTHCDNTQDSYLINIPEVSDIYFEQMRREVWCRPGGFIIEDSNEPFLFQYPKANAMWVLKIPGDTLRARIRNPALLCAIALDATTPAAQLFMNYLRFLMAHWQSQPRQALSMMGLHLVDLLILALESNPSVVRSEHSAVREAHLRRIEVYIRANLSNPQLTPSLIASTCGLSPRYLHMLFQEAQYSVSEWIRELRLQAAREYLERCPASTRIADVAYQWGFTDQAGFSNAFKQRFEITPSQFKTKVQHKRHSTQV